MLVRGFPSVRPSLPPFFPATFVCSPCGAADEAGVDVRLFEDVRAGASERSAN